MHIFVVATSLALMLVSQTGRAENSHGMPSTIPGYLQLGHYQIFNLDLTLVDIPEIVKVIGETKLSKGPHGTEAICYQDSGERRFIYEKLPNGFGYSVGKDSPEDETWRRMIALHCSSSTHIDMYSANNAGLRLGSSSSDVQSLLGKPSEANGDTWEFHYLASETKQTKKELVRYEVFSTVTLTFTNEKVSYFSIYTTVSRDN